MLSLEHRMCDVESSKQTAAMAKKNKRLAQEASNSGLKNTAEIEALRKSRYFARPMLSTTLKYYAIP